MISKHFSKSGEKEVLGFFFSLLQLGHIFFFPPEKIITQVSFIFFFFLYTAVLSGPSGHAATNLKRL